MHALTVLALATTLLIAGVYSCLSTQPTASPAVISSAASSAVAATETTTCSLPIAYYDLGCGTLPTSTPSQTLTATVGQTVTLVCTAPGACKSDIFINDDGFTSFVCGAGATGPCSEPLVCNSDGIFEHGTEPIFTIGCQAVNFG